LTSLKIGIVIQCRLNSKRLPGKSLMKIGGKSLIEHSYLNAIKSELAHDCFVAIPNTNENNELAEYLNKKSIPFIRGSEQNLVARHLLASDKGNFEIIVRIPGDNPLPHYKEVDRIIKHHCSENIQGFSTNLSEIFSSGYPDGIGAEVFTRETLLKVDQKSAGSNKLEHLHLNFFNYKTQKSVNKNVRVSTIKCPSDFARPDIRLDINTEQDLQYIRQMYDYFNISDFSINDIIRWHDLTKKSKYKNTIG